MSHFECVLQDGTKDCGVCALLTIVKTYGGEVSKEYLRTITRTGKNGVSAYYLLEAGKSLGFSTKGVEGDFRMLTKEELPCIAHTLVNDSYHHFVVIHEINTSKKIITIADPAIGIRSLSFHEFERISTKKYLIFTPIRPIIKEKKKVSIKKEILLFCSSKRKTITIAILLSVLFGILQVISSFSFQIFLEEGISSYSSTNLITGFICFFLITSFYMAFQILRNSLFLHFTNQLNCYLFTQTVTHLFSLPYLYFKNRPTGEVLSRLQDLNELNDGLLNFFISILLDGISFIILGITLFLIAPSIAYLLGGGLVLFFVISRLFRRPLKEKMTSFIQEASLEHSSLCEAVQGISTIKNLQMETSFSNHLASSYKDVLNTKEEVATSLMKKSIFLTYGTKVLLLLLLLIGGEKVLNGSLSTSKFFASYTLSTYLVASFQNLLAFYDKFNIYPLIIKRLEEIRKCPSEDIEFASKATLKEWQKGITIKNLTYHYLPNQVLLKNFSCFLPRGEKILMYGDSGSGKSTFVKLLLRYVTVPNQTIFLDDRDITDYALYDWRSKISYLSQEEILFTDTVYQNVVLYRDYSYDEFLKVSEVANLNFIKDKSTLGYSYLLEENGFNLSGGERARILIARTLLKKAELYIFDESFSEIDVPTERKILKAMFKLYPDKTFLVISHRQSNKDLYQKKIIFKKELAND